MISDLLSISSAFGIPFLIKALIPGLIFALLLLPILNPILPSIVRIDKLSDLATILLPGALILGLILSLSSGVIYRIYEGRLLWSEGLHKKFTDRIDKRVKKKHSEAEELRQSGDTSSARYRELWYWLRIFPRDDKNAPIATRPTILGNILDGYEGYPTQRYGMDSIFYWYRLWPTLPESFTKSMDRLWAEADCFMHISFSAILLFLLYGVLALAKFTVSFMTKRYISVPESVLNLIFPVPEAIILLLISLGCLITWYLLYRLSLPLHRRNGEYFKVIFDLYRNNIIGLTEFKPDEKANWRAAWARLQYMRIQCQKCKKYYYIGEEECPECKTSNPQKKPPTAIQDGY